MPSSLTDRLLLALDRRLGAKPAAPEALQLPAAPFDFRDGTAPVVWLAASDPQSIPALLGAVSHLGARFPQFDFVVTPATGPAGPDPADLAAFLDRLNPVATVLTGSIFHPALIAALDARQVPILGAMLRMPQGHWLEHRLARPLARRLVAGFQRLLAEDDLSLSALGQLGATSAQLALGGVLSDPVAVPKGNAAELESLTELMRGRPVWCAASLPLAELDVIAEAQRQALRRSHRLLLVVVPQRVEEAPQIAERLSAAGLICGLRSGGDDPVDDISAYVADLEGEIGLWLRLAPVSFIGGTLTRSAPSRTPIEAAALGSAILHGPEIAPFASAYGRLSAAGAARMVTDAAALAEAVDLLIQPEHAAIMAHAGWEVASAGDEAAEALARALQPVLAPLAKSA